MDSASGEDVARTLAKVWAGGVQRVLSQGLPPADVARSLVAVGLELLVKTEGVEATADQLAKLEGELRSIEGPESPVAANDLN